MGSWKPGPQGFMQKRAPAEQDQRKVHDPAHRADEEQDANLALSAQDAREGGEV